MNDMNDPIDKSTPMMIRFHDTVWSHDDLVKSLFITRLYRFWREMTSVSNRSGINYTIKARHRLVSGPSVWHRTFHANHWYHFFEIRWPIDIKINGITFCEIHRFIANMFDCNRIAFTARNHPDISNPLQWRHNGCGGVSNHQPHARLFTQLFI